MEEGEKHQELLGKMESHTHTSDKRKKREEKQCIACGKDEKARGRERTKGESEKEGRR